jgi:carotenoid cleavage dioxygenase-like enzyme
MSSRFAQALQTQATEVENQPLSVQGRLPAWLTGTLIRNTPAQFEVGSDNYRHWFDGLAMLHAFAINDGEVNYSNRYLQSRAYRENNAEGRIRYSEFASDPCRSLFGRVMSVFSAPEFGGNANVNVARLANRYLALTEVPMAVEFDPATLETLGVEHYQGTDGQITTAHPHFDADKGVALTYSVKLGPANTYNFYRMDGQHPDLIGMVPVQKPGYIHSFSITENYLVLAEYPLKLPSALDLQISNKPFIENYEWRPEEGARFLIVDRKNGALVAEVAAESFFAFHHINAFEQGDTIVCDIAAYDDSRVIDDFYLDQLRAEGGGTPPAEFRRYRLPLAGGQALFERISTQSFELPRINYERCNMRPYRYAFGAGLHNNQRDFLNQLVKIDLETGDIRTWYSEGCYPGEPIFVAAPAAQAEDEGIILSVVLDSTDNSSFLLALDAADFSEIARAGVPQTVPFGFHGQFFNA